MKLFGLILFSCFSLFSLACVFGQKSVASAQFDDPWPRLIATLNQGIDQDDVSVDLLELNRIELQEIDSARASEEKNTFFASRIQALNEKTTQSFVQQEKSPNQSRRQLASRVIEEIESNPITASSAAYDFEDGNQIGFCFGRALMAHYLLLKAGIAQKDIRKVFAIGDLMVNRQIWQFHVAVMVRDGENGWIVVDPLQNAPRNFAQWMKEMEAFDIKFPFSRTRFYVTDPRKFLPSSGAYDRSAFSHPSLCPYFEPLGRMLAARPVPIN